MPAGQLRERVTFQQRTPDANNDRLGPWADDFTVWARVMAVRGSEAVLQERLQGIQPLEVTVRSASPTRAVTTAWRLTWRGDVYSIRSLAPDERRAFIAIMAELDQSDG